MAVQLAPLTGLLLQWHGHQVWRVCVAVNVLNIQWQSADKKWSSGFGDGQAAKNFSPWKLNVFHSL